ncbi:MAG TPA: CDP-alcohol phosphatidyltransferase family protein [Polyangiaceae bacterium]|nr:CDP-alcohol phosphatidyltransferase family protein [Polyangiaceae bacterium]
MAWVLVLDRPSGDPTQIVAGLPIALRLALDAQAARAEAIVIAPGAENARPALSDARLKLPVVDAAPAGARRVRVPASYVLHRGLFRKLVELDTSSSERDLATQPFAHGAAWGFDPIDVADAASRARAEKALFRALRKPEDGWTSRYLNRYISLFFSRLLIHTPLTPNQVSVAILGVGLGGAVSAAQGTPGSLMLGAALLQAQSVLDGCDGELSRVSHRGSRRGEWLDTIGDDLSNYGFFTGAGIGLYRMSGSWIYLAAGLLTVVAGVIASGLEYRYLIRIGSGDLLKYPLSQQTNTRREGPLSALAPLFKRDTFVFLTLIAALLGWLGPVLVVFSLAAVGVLIAVIRTELRLAREGAA